MEVKRVKRDPDNEADVTSPSSDLKPAVQLGVLKCEKLEPENKQKGHVTRVKIEVPQQRQVLGYVPPPILLKSRVLRLAREIEAINRRHSAVLPTPFPTMLTGAGLRALGAQLAATPGGLSAYEERVLEAVQEDWRTFNHFFSLVSLPGPTFHVRAKKFIKKHSAPILMGAAVRLSRANRMKCFIRDTHCDSGVPTIIPFLLLGPFQLAYYYQGSQPVNFNSFFSVIHPPGHGHDCSEHPCRIKVEFEKDIQKGEYVNIDYRKQTRCTRKRKRSN